MPLTPPLTKFTTQSPAIVSYDYNDFASGEGIVIFNGFYDIDGVTTLSTEQIYSSVIEISATASVNVWTTLYDLDFDLTAFNKSQTIRGNGLVELGYNFDQTTFGYMRFVVTVRKWDGATETDLATATHTKTNAPDQKGAAALKITIPESIFSAGEILRLNIVAQVRADTSGAIRLTLGTDPYNRDGTYIIPSTDTPTTTTRLKFYCPFKIEE